MGQGGLKAPEEAAHRAARVREAWESRDAEGPMIVPTAAGQVEITEIKITGAPTEPAAVEVWVGQPRGGDPHYRIINPPTMVRRPDGSLADDPLAAIAEVIAGEGGARRARARARKEARR